MIEQPKTGSVDRIETYTTPMPCSQKKLRGQDGYITVGQYNQEPKKECVPRLRQPVGSRCGLSQQRPPVLRSCCTVEQMLRSDRLHGFHSQTPPKYKPPSLPPRWFIQAAVPITMATYTPPHPTNITLLS